MGIFSKKRSTAQTPSETSSNGPSSSSYAPSNSASLDVPAGASPYLYGESSAPTFKLIHGRRRRDSDASLRSTKTTGAAILGGSKLSSPYPSSSISESHQRSADSLPLSHQTSSSRATSVQPRHTVSPLSKEATEMGAATASSKTSRSTFGAFFKKKSNQRSSSATSSSTSSSRPTTLHAADSEVRSGEFNLRSFRSASALSNNTNPKPGPTPLQEKAPSSNHVLLDETLPAPSPAFAHASGHSRNASSRPSGHKSVSSQSSISVSQFNQARALRSSTNSLRSASSSTSLTQLSSSIAPEEQQQQTKPSQPSTNRYAPGPPLSRPTSSKLDLPLPTPSRVAPLKPLPQRRTSSIDPTMDVYADYFTSPIVTPADELDWSKHELLASPPATTSSLPGPSTDIKTSPKSEELLPSPPISDTAVSSKLLEKHHTADRPSAQRTLSGTSLLDVASGFGASLSSYLSSMPLHDEPKPIKTEEARASRRGRTNSTMIGQHAWGEDSDSEDNEGLGDGSEDSEEDGGNGPLQFRTRRSQAATLTPPRRQSSASTAWNSDDAVIRREEARKQALLAQTSPFTRSSYAPPSVMQSPKAPAKQPLAPATNSASPVPGSLSPLKTPVKDTTPTAPLIRAPLQEEALEVLNKANKTGSAVDEDDDDDDEAPLASIAGRISHHRAQSELCIPTANRRQTVGPDSFQNGAPFPQHFAQFGSFPVPPPSASVVAPQTSTSNLRAPQPPGAKVRGKPSLSALVDAYGKFDPNTPIAMAPPSLGYGPRRPESTLSVQSRSSRRSLSADHVHTFRHGSTVSVSSESSRGPATPDAERQSVHQRMASRHKADAMKHASSLVQVEEPSGKLPPPTSSAKPYGSVSGPTGFGGLPHYPSMMSGQMPLQQAMGAGQALPGIDPHIWANLSADQRLNLAMNQLAMYQSAQQAMQFMTMSGQSANGSVLGMPGSTSIIGFPPPQGFPTWGGNGSVMSGYQPQAPFAGSRVSVASHNRAGTNTHSFINQR